MNQGILDKILSEYPFDSETVKSGRLLIKILFKIACGTWQRTDVSTFAR
jgi:hypothetical protein